MDNRKTALITGSTSGIGLGMAKALAAAGYDIMLNGFGNADEIASLVEALRNETGVRVEYDDADLMQPAQVRAVVHNTVSKLGSIDVLVNNAGIQHVSPIETFPEDSWHQIIALNLSAAFFASREALPIMRGKGWGRIINTSSVHGMVASVDKAAYVAAKHGIIGLTKVTALETAGSGITCNAICPGFVQTPLVNAQVETRASAAGVDFDTAAATMLGDKQPSGAFVTVEQIGGLVAYLCTPLADQITGANLAIDGGWTAQ
ncbi:MAG: 3-hydroxybutyrate dehydrogenase [Gammaproteobacteria bacterium]|jgi:3-hydroxybutyrate dehydrogenase